MIENTFSAGWWASRGGKECTDEAYSRICTFCRARVKIWCWGMTRDVVEYGGTPPLPPPVAWVALSFYYASCNYLKQSPGFAGRDFLRI
jgi:hypothetical protein